MKYNLHSPFRFDKISFYIVAHADDWQLFMHPNIYVDLMAPNCKVIFIITTAGDAGKGEKYWLAREEGMKSSVRFCLTHVPESTAKKKFNHHSIDCWSAGKTTSYFLRLPDGGLDGKGFADRNFQSLVKFKSGHIETISSLGNAVTYDNWAELTGTIESIITFESQDISDVWIHYLDPDTTINRDDHPDHIMTGHVIQNMIILTNLHQVLYIGYGVSSIAKPLPVNDLFWKAGMFAVYDKAIYDLCGYSTLREKADLYLKWCCSGAEYTTILPGDTEKSGSHLLIKQ